MVATLGVSEDRLVERRWARQHADAIAGDAGEHFRNVEDELGQSGRAANQAREPAGLVAEGVKEGVHDQVAVAFAEPHDIGPGFEGAEVLAVGGHHALGLAGGPRSEEEIREVARFDLCRPASRFVFGNTAAALEETFPALSRFAGAAQDQRSLELGQDLARDQLRVVHPEKLAHGAEETRAALLQDVAGFGPLEPRVERDHNRARRLGAKCGDDPFVDVRRPDCDAIARGDAARDEGARCAKRERFELSERNAQGLAVDEVFDGRRIPEAFRCNLYEPRNRFFHALISLHPMEANGTLRYAPDRMQRGPWP